MSRFPSLSAAGLATPASIFARLREHLYALGSPAKVSVVIAADGAAEHRHVIEVMDVLRGEHVTQVAFAVQALEATP